MARRREQARFCGLGRGISGFARPHFALVGAGSLPALVLLASALHGTWLYGAVSGRRPG